MFLQKVITRGPRQSFRQWHQNSAPRNQPAISTLRSLTRMAEIGLHAEYCLDWISGRFRFVAALVLALWMTDSALFGQETVTPADSNATQTQAKANVQSTDANSQRLERLKGFRAIDLPSVDQLVLVLSNATDASGNNRQEVLVFLGRSKNRGWEKIGDGDLEELALHWRTVAQRQMEQYVHSGLSSEQLEKINLAVEVSIAQFQRLYHELRTDFLDQPDQKSRLAVLANDSRYERLRQLGREGFFRENSLVAKTINKALADAVQ
ncbi:MAG: hypothetical protein U0930_03085 [Pirellulales bacterium]